jgi:hypothetical protein
MENDTQHLKVLGTGKIPNCLCEATFYLKERSIIDNVKEALAKYSS